VDRRDGELLAWVRASVEAHLHAAPQAADTLEGIACFWLGRRGEGIPRALLERALEELVAEARLVRCRLPDGTVLYRGATGRSGP